MTQCKSNDSNGLEAYLAIISSIRGYIASVAANLLFLIFMPLVVLGFLGAGLVFMVRGFLESSDPTQWNQAVLLATALTVMFALVLFGNFAS
jgi:hypothetical protein